MGAIRRQFRPDDRNGNFRSFGSTQRTAKDIRLWTGPDRRGFQRPSGRPRDWRQEMTSEERRLKASHERREHGKRWGPYLSERAWGTVREDYSDHGTAWEYLPHDHARSRAYRWNEDGIAGICDRHQKICFALGLWNGVDPILKERLFGL